MFRRLLKRSRKNRQTPKTAKKLSSPESLEKRELMSAAPWQAAGSNLFIQNPVSEPTESAESAYVASADPAPKQTRQIYRPTTRSASIAPVDIGKIGPDILHAETDTFTSKHGEVFRVSVTELMKNDRGFNLRILEGTTTSEEGGLVEVRNGILTYTPPEKTIANDSFGYRLEAQFNLQDIVPGNANIGIIVRPNPVTRGRINLNFTDIPPIAKTDNISVDPDSTKVIRTRDLLANDIDLDGAESKLRIIDVTPTEETDGTVVLEGEQIRYTANENHGSNAAFEYTVVDEDGNLANGRVEIKFFDNPPGGGSSETTPLLPNWVNDLGGNAFEILGTAGDDQISIELKGRKEKWYFVNRNGESFRLAFEPNLNSLTVRAGAGNDYVENKTAVATRIFGDAGNDRLLGGSGNDSLTGGDGNDLLQGRDGNDVVAGGNGNDTLKGGGGRDVLNGEAGNDHVAGGKGHDKLYGGEDRDWLYGGDGNDRLYGQEGDDDMWGGDGHDQLHGWTGIDSLFGELGNDVLYGDDGNDQLFGGEGVDKIYGGNGDDRILGGDADDALYGEAGNDFLSGEAGNDILRGGVGNDRLDGNKGDDNLDGQDGDDRLEGGFGNDVLSGSAGNDRLYGQAGSDYLSGNAGNDYLDGGSGDDKLVGAEGNDVLYGQAGNDELRGGNGNDLVQGGDGDDVLYGGRGNDRLVSRDNNRTNDRLYGGLGSDVFDAPKREILDS